jgi:hypothetical protein
LEVIRALTTIAKLNPALLGSVPAVPSLCFTIAIGAGGFDHPRWDEGADANQDLDEESDGLTDLIGGGLKLARTLMKKFPGACVQCFPGGVREFAMWGNEQVQSCIAMAVRDILLEAAAMGAQFHLVSLEAGGETKFPELVLGLLRTVHDSQVAGSLLKALTKLIRGNPAATAQFFEEILQVALAAVRRELPSQAGREEEQMFDYETDIQPAAQDVLAAAIREYKAEFPMAFVFEAFGAVVPRVSDLEAAAIVGVIADWADVGGPIPADWINFALAKIAACDFTIPSDPIFLVRVLIRSQPADIAAQVGPLVAYFAEILRSEVSKARYYWNTVTNVIAAVFEIALSAAFRDGLPLGDFLGPVLAKLPVRGDYREAQFICEALLTIYGESQEVIAPHLAEFFRVVTQTLANRDVWFAKAELKDETRAGLVRAFQGIAGGIPNCEEVVQEALGGDPVKLATLQARVSG